MTEAVLTSRRQVLKMLTSAPMLPLTGALASSTALLAACGGGAALESVSFSSMAAPSLADAAAMATTTVGSVMTTTFSDGTSTDFELAYEPFFITGDEVANLNGGSILAGSYFDIHGKPIMDTTGPVRCAAVLLRLARRHLAARPLNMPTCTASRASLCLPWCSSNTPRWPRMVQPACTASCLRPLPC